MSLLCEYSDAKAIPVRVGFLAATGARIVLRLLTYVTVFSGDIKTSVSAFAGTPKANSFLSVVGLSCIAKNHVIFPQLCVVSKRASQRTQPTTL